MLWTIAIRGFYELFSIVVYVLFFPIYSVYVTSWNPVKGETKYEYIEFLEYVIKQRQRYNKWTMMTKRRTEKMGKNKRVERTHKQTIDIHIYIYI